jgi:GT2 family glycosyltransferase
MNPGADLAVVIVSWNVWDLLRACLRAIEAQSTATQDPHVRRFGPQGQGRLRVVVVDNGSQDATPQLLTSQFPWVQAILSLRNLGFTGGNNLALAGLGLAQAQALFPQQSSFAPSPSFVYFLNPDTEPLPGSLWSLYTAIQGDERVAAVGPLLLYGDGSAQSTRRRFPTRLTGFFESTWLGQLWPGNPWARRYHLADWPAHLRQDVDWVVGAALLVRWQALTQIGPFDPDFFMYSEETDLCRRLKQAGWRVVYDPSATVIHYEARSSDQVSALRHLRFNRSKVRYYRKWFGPLWAELLRRYLLLEYQVQMRLEQAKALLGHKRTMRQKRIQSYRQVIQSGLSERDGVHDG